MNFVKETLVRLKAESPSYFKKVRLFADWLTATGLGLVGVPAAIEQMAPQFDFDLSLLMRIASYMIVAGIVIKVFGKLPVSDPEVLK